MRGRGIVPNEPSVVAINIKTGHIMAIRPLKGGVIADFDVCATAETLAVGGTGRLHGGR